MECSSNEFFKELLDDLEFSYSQGIRYNNEEEFYEACIELLSTRPITIISNRQIVDCVFKWAKTKIDYKSFNLETDTFLLYLNCLD